MQGDADSTIFQLGYLALKQLAKHCRRLWHQLAASNISKAPL